MHHHGGSDSQSKVNDKIDAAADKAKELYNDAGAKIESRKPAKRSVTLFTRWRTKSSTPTVKR